MGGGKYMNYKKSFNFGKVAYNGKSKYNQVTLEVKLRVDNKVTFSASGEVWNRLHSDILMGGQCIDDIYNDFKHELSNISLYKNIMGLWRKWHLNDMHPDCIHQRELGWSDILLDDSRPKTQDNMASWTYPKRQGLELLGYKLYEFIPFNFVIGGEYNSYIKISMHKIKNLVKKLFKVDVWRDESKAHAKGVMGKPCPVCGYKYGTSWVHEPISNQDLDLIMELLEVPSGERSRIRELNK